MDVAASGFSRFIRPAFIDYIAATVTRPGSEPSADDAYYSS